MRDPPEEDRAALLGGDGIDPHDTLIDPPRVSQAAVEEQQKAEVAARAKALYGDEDHEADAADADRALAALDRMAARERAGPQTIAPQSNGGSNVAYTAVTRPARGRQLRDPTGKVKLAELLEETKPGRGRKPTAVEREAPTFVIARARAKTRAGRALTWVVLAVGLAAALGAMTTSLRRPTAAAAAGASSGARGSSAPIGTAAPAGTTRPEASTAPSAAGRPSASTEIRESDGAGTGEPVVGVRAPASAPGVGPRVSAGSKPPRAAPPRAAPSASSRTVDGRGYLEVP